MTLRPLDRKEVAQLGPYYRGRWVYLRHAARLLHELAPRTVLEVGPGPHRFVHGSDTLDLDEGFGPTFHHDAGAAPWPAKDGSYDLVLALQCWEHFEGRQTTAFQEAVRVAGPGGHVLISFPYRWQNTNATHRGIGVRRIREWTCEREPVRRVLVRKPEGRARLLLLFRGGVDDGGAR